MDFFFDDSEAIDRAYINIRDGLPWDLPEYTARMHVEELYQETRNLLDKKKFYSQRLTDFFACYAEMYFASTFMSRCGHELTHPSNEGLDFFIPKFNCWLEVVKATNGETLLPDSIPEINMDNCQGYPEAQVILRLTNAIHNKWCKTKKDIKKMLVKPNQPVVICISGGELDEKFPMYHAGGYPQIVKAVLPVGDTKFWLSRGSKKLISREINYQASIDKSNGASIHKEFFLDKKYSDISAVIYSFAHAGMPSPLRKSQRGCDFFTVHNPLATNPLPQGFINCGIEYFVDVFEDSVFIRPPVDHESAQS